MRYHIWTVGCQMNLADSERMATALAAMGGTPASQVQDADVIVLNTCSVREAAENRALGKLSSLRSLKRSRPDVIVALAGCMVGEDSLPDLHRKLPFVDTFIKPGDVAALRETVRALAPAGSLFAPENAPANGTAAGALPSQSTSTIIRWVPVIHGCNRSCSYCIVPARRGHERSRPVEEIEADVCAMVAEGAREVRLLGQIIDRYGRDLPGKRDLADLFARLGMVKGLYRVRFLTSHPRDLSERVIEAIAAEPKVCEDLNLPVQAGDDDILKSMRRGYTTAYYRRLIEHLRERIPGLALSTDVIVGYPGETDAQFERSLRLLAAIRFDVVHVAMYSPRPGTLAAELPDDVPQPVKKERLQRVEQQQEAIATEINAGLHGQTVEVLVEGRHQGKWTGRTRGNKPVFFPAEENWSGRLALVKIDRAGPWSLSGQVVGGSPAG